MSNEDMIQELNELRQCVDTSIRLVEGGMIRPSEGWYEERMHGTQILDGTQYDFRIGPFCVRRVFDRRDENE